MGMEELGKGKGRKGSACREEEVESVLIGRVAMKAHLGVEGEALVLGLGGRVGLDDLVVEEDGWFGRVVEEEMGILEVWDFK